MDQTASQGGNVSGVQWALPVVRASVFTTDGSGVQLTVYGVDLMDEAVEDTYGFTSGGEDILDEPLVFVSQPDSVATPSRHGAASTWATASS